MIEKRRLGQNDIEITPIGLGCQQLAVTGLVGRAWDTPDEAATNAIVKAALAGGVNGSTRRRCTATGSPSAL
jgi:aryl-alcohol dehydrogenase-like predicted oxidoreductase